MADAVAEVIEQRGRRGDHHQITKPRAREALHQREILGVHGRRDQPPGQPDQRDHHPDTGDAVCDR